MGHHGAVGPWVHPPSTSHLGESKPGPCHAAATTASSVRVRALLQSFKIAPNSALPKILGQHTFVGRFRTYLRRSVPKITFMGIFSTAVSSKTVLLGRDTHGKGYCRSGCICTFIFDTHLVGFIMYLLTHQYLWTLVTYFP